MINSSTDLADLAALCVPVLRNGYVDPLALVSRPVVVAPTESQKKIVPPVVSSKRVAVTLSPAHRLEISGLDPAQAVDLINGSIKNCTACGLCQSRTKTVPGTGSIHPVAMVIGEAPGGDEDRIGLPFVGAAGQFLDKWLEAIGLSRYSNIYIANTLKCRPPQNRDPSSDEISACSGYLLAQIEALKPRAILALGRFASSWLMQAEVVMADIHGKVFDFQGIPWMPTYHPSAVLRNAELKRPVWEDLKGFKDLCVK